MPTPSSTFPLRVQGARFIGADGKDPRVLGTIIGCHIEGLSGWPLVCKESLQAIHDAGLDWTHVRTGPFTAEAEAPEFAFYKKSPAGKYDLTKINPDFIGLLRTRIADALALGIVVEVDLPMDRWPVQHKVSPWMAQNNSQGEEHSGLSIFQSPPDSVHEAALRAIVSQTCDLSNVVYSEGNEAFKSDSHAWSSRVVQIVHELCPGRPVGANSPEGAAHADYAILHQSSAPAPPASGAPIEVNEFEDPGPSPVGVISEALRADSLHTYFMYWRGSHSSQQWLDTMKELGKIRAQQPVPTPAPPICHRPDFEDPSWVNTCRRKGDMGKPTCPASDQQVFSPQMQMAQSRVPAPPSNAGEAEVVAYLDALASDFQHQGVCAWHDHDAVMAQHSQTEWFELHPWNFSGGTVLDPAASFIAKWTGPPQPLPSPTPTPGPAPTPTPTPVPGTCPIPITAGNWVFDLKPHGGQLLDLTPWIGNPAHLMNQPWPGCGVNRCPLSCEKGPLACECQQVLFGTPIWGTSGGPCTIIPQANPFTVKVATGSCALFVKGSKITPSSQPWEVRATSPACNVGSNGLCQ